MPVALLASVGYVTFVGLLLLFVYASSDRRL